MSLPDTDAILAAASTHGWQPPEAPVGASSPSAFGSGLRSGFSTAKGQLNRLVGSAGESLGFSDFARDRYTAADEAARQAALEAPPINSFEDVHDLRTGGQWLAGMAGRAVPVVGAALGAGLMARTPLGALGAATAATAPFEVGGALQKYSEDPVMAAKPIDERLATALPTGAASAAVQNVVPLVMGGKLLGKTVAGATERGAGATIATNLAEGVGGNAAAGAAAEGIHLAGETALDPNRDTSKDEARLKEAAIGGGAMGAIFGVAGATGDLVHGSKRSLTDVGDAIKDKSWGIYNKLKGKDADAEVAAKISRDEPLVPVVDEATFNQSEQTAIQKATEYAQELLEKTGLPEDTKAKVAQAAQDLGDATNRAYVASVKVAEQTRVKVMDQVSDLHDRIIGNDKAKSLADTITTKFDEIGAKLSEKGVPGTLRDASKAITDTYQRALDGIKDADMKTKAQKVVDDASSQAVAAIERAKQGGAKEVYENAIKTARDLMAAAVRQVEAFKGTKQSADYSGTRATIREAVMPALKEARPEILDHPAAFDMLADSLSAFVRHIDEGKPMHKDDNVMAHLYDVFGDNTRNVLERVHTAVGLDTPKHRDQFFNVLRETMQSESAQKSSFRVVADNLTPENQDATPAQIKEAASMIDNYVNGRFTRSRTPNEQAYIDAMFREQMQELFGPNAEQVLAHYESMRDARSSEDAGRAAYEEDTSVADLGEHDPFDRNLTDREGSAMFEAPRFYGAKDSPFVPSHEAHVRDYGNEASQATRLKRQLEKDNPDSVVNEITASEYAKLTGMDEATLNRLTGGKPDEYVTMLVEGMKQEGKLSLDEARAMLLDSKSRADSKSRIDTERNGITLDAVRITREMKKLGHRQEGETPIQYTKRSFLEGLGSALDFFNTKVKGELSPDTIIAYHGGEALTLKMLEGLPSSRKDTYEPGIEKDATPRELREMSAELEKKIEPLRKQVAEMLEGKKLSKEEYKAEFSSLMKELDTEGLGAEQYRYDRELEKRTIDGDKQEGARQDPSKDAQIHQAVKDLGEDNITNEFSLDGSPLSYRTTPDAPNVGKDGTVTFAGKMRLKEQLEGMQKSDNAAARRIGDRGMALLERINDMEPADQLRLASIIGEKSNSKMSLALNRLDKDEAGIKAEPGIKLDLSVEMIRDGGKNMDRVLTAAAKSDNAQGLRDLATKLIDSKLDEPNVKVALDVLNRRIETLVKKSPEVAYDLQRKANAEGAGDKEITAKQKLSVEKYIDDVLGTRVKLEFSRIPNAGDFTKNNVRDIIRISIHALDPLGTAYHESLHAFFKGLRDQSNFKVMEPLFRAADSEHVMKQLRERFKDEPSVLKQLEVDKEERVAYMYQLWAKDALTLAPTVKGIFTRIKEAVLKAMGIWTNDQRAEHIMNYFHSGEFKNNFGDRNAVANAMLKPGTNKAVEYLKNALEPINHFGTALASAGGERLRDTGIPQFQQIADKIQPKQYGDAKDPGFIVASRSERTARMNTAVKALQDFSDVEMNAVHDALKTGTKPTDAKILKGYESIRNLLDDTFDYMQKAGVDIKELGYGKDYFPRIWDAEFISKNQQAFKDMLGKYVAKGMLTDADIPPLMNKLMALEGSDLGIEVDRPGMQHARARLLKFIDPADAAPFVQKSLFETLNSYMGQASRRAEWARRFNDDGSVLRSMIDQASAEHGATKAQVDMVQDYVRGVNGTLGDNINPVARRLFGNMIVYQNVRLLPLAIFSSVIDPMGIMVRGGTVADAAAAFKRGIMEIPRGFKKDNTAKDDGWYKLAEDMGVIDNTALMHTIGTMYSQGMVSSLGKKINDTFFRFNLMEQFNTSMRVSATEAALKFMQRHAEGQNEHSQRYLDELGLQKSDVIVKDGRPLVRADEFVKHGMTEEQAVEASNRMRGALNRWVDGAVLRPNASDKPIWMNDPHWALMAHLKQFTYAFQHTIIDRVVHEAERGNYTPAMALASYVPIMVAADMVKGMIQGGGEQPSWKKGWGAEDYFESGVERAGLYGVGQFGVDFMKDIHHGGVGIGSLTGPAAGQLLDALKVMGGREQAKSFVFQSLPANSLLAGIAKMDATDPNFAE